MLPEKPIFLKYSQNVQIDVPRKQIILEIKGYFSEI